MGEPDSALTSSQIGPPNLAKRSQGFQGPIKAPSSAMASEALEVGLDAAAHVLVERALRGGQVGGGGQG